MRKKEIDAEGGAAPHPRATGDFEGHHGAEEALLEAYRSGRLPHAWLLGGPRGIGKASLAYRFARFVLAFPDPSAREVQQARSLRVDQTHPAFRRVAAQAHPDLLVLERSRGETGDLRNVITVDDVRRTIGFFGSTAGEGGWRVCLVDSTEELQLPQAANALLKVLEEPPPRSLFLLVSHAPGRLLPTIRSRCRFLPLRGLETERVARIVSALTGRSEEDAQVLATASKAEGSIGAALALIEGRTLAIRQRVENLLRDLPAGDPLALHALGDELAGSDTGLLAAFTETVRGWLSAQLARPSSDLAALAKVAEVWEKLDRAARDVEIYNLERKPLVFEVFGWLAEAARADRP